MTARRRKRAAAVDRKVSEVPLRLVEGAVRNQDCAEELMSGLLSDCNAESPAVEPLASIESESISSPEQTLDESATIEDRCTEQAPGIPEQTTVASDSADNAQRQEKDKPIPTQWTSLLDALEHFRACSKPIYDWLWTLRAPLFLLIAIAIKPKLILLWVFVILAKPLSTWLYDRAPEEWKTKFKLALPGKLRNSSFLRDMSEGADQGLPFILFWLYLCCAPFAIGWIALHWMKGFFPSQNAESKIKNGFVFTQNRRLDSVHSENNFYHSRAFGIILFAFFALGIPAFFSYSVYENTGLERLMKASHNPSPYFSQQPSPPSVDVPPVGLANRPRRGQIDTWARYLTFVTGYNGYWPWLQNFKVEPTKASVFFVHFYLMSLATAISVLFFRAWFMFPLNFLADEHDIVFTESGIKRKSLKSWFLSVVTFNRVSVAAGADSLFWHEVKSLRRLEDGFFKLSPLPETAFNKESLSYKLLNKLASFIDGMTSRSYTGNYLIFSSTENEGDFGKNIKINLNDLNREQRAKLFYSVKKWAPHVIVKEGVEQQLVGSTVLRDNRYTQLWFDMLTHRARVKKSNVLETGESLKGGAYLIDERLSSGGQATAYLATRQDGEKCVLKEFILATSTNTTPIESAREFEAEVSLLSQLNHPGIVKLEDFFFEDGRVYVALEYINGQTLRQKVQQDGPLEDKEVVQITASICDILEYLHGCNPPIVHRDITPENILIRADGSIKLIDFSLAVRQDGKPTTDSCAKQCFTPPEQFREEACLQSDIYSLGATMYYLLTGLVPKPISCSSPQTKAAQVSDELNAIVERATKLDLNQRYESVYWLKLELANLAAKEDEMLTAKVDSPSIPD